MRIWSASSQRLDAEIEKCWIVRPLGCAESERHLRHDDKGETRYAAYMLYAASVSSAVCCMHAAQYATVNSTLVDTPATLKEY
jgi:hypothetical protein